MMVSSLQQLDFFLFSILAGQGMGFLYNLLAAIQRKAGGRLSLLSDYIFWSSMAATVIALGIKFNDGGIRGYQILGVMIGFILHFLVLGRISEKLASLIAEILAKLIFPLVFLMRGLGLYFESVLKKIGGFCSKISKNRQKVTARGKVRKKIQKKYKKML